MDAKQWLSRGWKIDQEIGALLKEQERALELACRATPIYCDDKVQTSKHNTSEERFVNYADYSAKIDQRIDELFLIKREILDAIAQVDNPVYRTLLTKRYIEFQTWEEIAVDMNYSFRWMMKMGNKALKDIEVHIPNVVSYTMS